MPVSVGANAALPQFPDRAHKPFRAVYPVSLAPGGFETITPPKDGFFTRIYVSVYGDGVASVWFGSRSSSNGIPDFQFTQQTGNRPIEVSPTYTQLTIHADDSKPLTCSVVLTDAGAEVLTYLRMIHDKPCSCGGQCGGKD